MVLYICIRLILKNLFTCILWASDGISMSGLAQILLDEGFTVSGSDSKQSALTEHLASWVLSFPMVSVQVT